jgi:hypothetical protein
VSDEKSVLPSEPPSLRLIFLDRVVKDEMAAQGIEIKAEWLNKEDDMLVFDLLPCHLRGPILEMRANAVDLVDTLIRRCSIEAEMNEGASWLT